MAERASSQNAAGSIGLALAALTVIITAINGLPAFLALRGSESHVAYEIERVQMLYPGESDRTTIRALLAKHRIPDAFVSIVLSNRGDVPAREVIVTIKVPGRIVEERTDPGVESKPAWVKLSKEFDSQKDDSRLRYVLNDLGLVKNLAIKVSYIAWSSSDPQVEIFYDGRPGILVSHLATVPENARAISFLPTLKVFGIGLLFSVAAYLFLRYRNAWTRRQQKGAMASKGWRRYKDEVVLCVAKTSGAALEAFADGTLDAKNPKEFWDGVVSIGERRVALEVHTSAQQAPSFTGEEEDQRRYALRVHMMACSSAPPITHVALINDEAIWAQTAPARMIRLFADLSRGSTPLKYLFISGSPEEVAARVKASLQDR